MKKFLKAMCLALSAILVFAFTACNFSLGGGNNSSEEGKKDWKEANTNCSVYPTTYTGIEKLKSEAEISAYVAETKNTLPVENGVIVSPYYKLSINGKNVPVYGARTDNGIHSFAYVDVEKIENGKPFALNTELSFLELSTVCYELGEETTVDVLPESKGVKANFSTEKVTCVIRDTGSYSFVFNSFHAEPLTLMVTKKDNTERLFGDYAIEYFEPGDYSTAEMCDITLFEQEETVYYFKKGRYKVDSFTIPAHSILYLEQGAYLEVMPAANGSRTSIINTYGKENVTVAGRGLFDFSACCGSVNEEQTGYKHDKSGYGFTCCTDVTFSGITTINSQNWTLCMTDVKGVQIDKCMFIAYRVFADGVMLSDCQDAIVEDCFVRTGDDGFETKSTSNAGLTDNVLFRNNAAWTDGAVAYGCIYEARHDTRNVRFENCSVGFALGTWSTHLGCCVIQLGNRQDAKTEDITFDGFEVYTSYNPAVCSIYTGGSGGAGIGWGHVNNIRFRNITVKNNYGVVLNLRTYDKDSSIKHVYLDNIVTGDIAVTPENFYELGLLRLDVKGGYDTKEYLHINTELD